MIIAIIDDIERVLDENNMVPERKHFQTRWQQNNREQKPNQRLNWKEATKVHAHTNIYCAFEQ